MTNPAVSEEMLLPCPFCGGEARLQRQSGTTRVAKSRWYRERVECTNCKTTTAIYKSPGKAINVWNRRATPAAGPSAVAVKALREMLVEADEALFVISGGSISEEGETVEQLERIIEANRECAANGQKMTQKALSYISTLAPSAAAEAPIPEERRAEFPNDPREQSALASPSAEAAKPVADLVKRLLDASDDPYFELTGGVQEWLKKNWALREEAASALSLPPQGGLREVREAIEIERAKVSGDDGYNYAAGQEYGLRLALVKIDAALAGRTAG